MILIVRILERRKRGERKSSRCTSVRFVPGPGHGANELLPSTEGGQRRLPADVDSPSYPCHIERRDPLLSGSKSWGKDRRRPRALEPGVSVHRTSRSILWTVQRIVWCEPRLHADHGSGRSRGGVPSMGALDYGPLVLLCFFSQIMVYPCFRISSNPRGYFPGPSCLSAMNVDRMRNRPGNCRRNHSRKLMWPLKRIDEVRGQKMPLPSQRETPRICSGPRGHLVTSTADVWNQTLASPLLAAGETRCRWVVRGPKGRISSKPSKTGRFDEI